MGPQEKLFASAIERKFVRPCLAQLWPRDSQVSISHSEFSVSSSVSEFSIQKGSSIAFQYANKYKYWRTINLWFYAGRVGGIWFVIQEHNC